MGCCTLSTNTPTPVFCCSCCAKNNIEPAINRRTSKNKLIRKQFTSLANDETDTHKVGVLNQYLGGLASKHNYNEVAEAKSVSRQNAGYKKRLLGVFIRGKTTRRGGGSKP